MKKTDQTQIKPGTFQRLSFQITLPMFEDYNDQWIIENIRAGGRKREHAWKHIAEYWGGYCCRTALLKTGCDDSEAKQGFSLACIGVDTRIRTANDLDFLKSASLKTYLTSASINAVRALLSQKKKESVLLGIPFPDLIGNDQDRWVEQEACRAIFRRALSGIGDRCKKVLLLFIDGFEMKEIVKEMGFKNEDVAKSEKWQCQEKFKAYLRANPELKNEIKANCYG